MISTAAPTTNTAIAICDMVIFPLLIFSGFFLNNK